MNNFDEQNGKAVDQTSSSNCLINRLTILFIKIVHKKFACIILFMIPTVNENNRICVLGVIFCFFFSRQSLIL